MPYTLYGLWQYMPDLFENVILPEEMNKNTLIDLIMERSGMLLPLHQQPDHFKRNVERWFTRKQYAFQRMWTALHEEYSPIENYDRYEDWTDTPDITIANSGGHDIDRTKTGGHTNTSAKSGGYQETLLKEGGHTETRTPTGTITVSDEYSGGHKNVLSGTNTTTATNTVSAYNSSAYEPNNQTKTVEEPGASDIFSYQGEAVDHITQYEEFSEKTQTQYNQEKFTTTHTNNSDTNTETFKYDGEKEHESFDYRNEAQTETGTRTHKGHLHGNIGVTTNQQMIESELALREYDIYEHIAVWFENDMLVQVY